MWQFLTNMSIARRLMLAAIITALVPGIVISILGSSYVSTLSTVNDTVQAEDNAVKLATDMQADLLRMNALLGALNMGPSSVADNVLNSREIVQLTTDFSSTLATYQKDYQISTSAKMEGIREALKSDNQGNQEPTSQHSMIYVVNLQWTLYNKAQQQILADMQQATSENTLVGDRAEANLEYLPLKGNLDNLVVLTESISQIVVQLNTFKIYPILFWTIAAFIFSTLVVFATSYVINLTITRPLRQLIQLTERIAQGDTNARALVTGHDEIYMVAISMNTMLDSIVSLMKNIQQQHDGLAAHVQKLIDEVKGLGSGDLRSRAEVTSDALGFLAHSFNYMIDELSSRMVRIKMVTDEVETLTSATQQHVTQLLQFSTHQIQNMAEAVRALEQMIASTDTVAQQSLALTIIAQETQKIAKSGYKAAESAAYDIERMYAHVQAAAGKFQTLEVSTLQVDDIVAVLSNIELQANRLQLAADAQVAVTGENNRGFVTIVTDIGCLTEQIKMQVTLMATQMRAGNGMTVNIAQAMRETEMEIANDAKRARQAIIALGSIVDRIEQQAQAIENINTHLNQQLHLSRSVLRIMQNAAEANRKSSDSTHEATHSIGKLSHLVGLLHSSLGTFKLREEL